MWQNNSFHSDAIALTFMVVNVGLTLFPLSLEGGLLPEGSVMAACFSPSATAGLVLSLCLSPSLWDWEEELLGRPCGRGSGGPSGLATCFVHSNCV